LAGTAELNLCSIRSWRVIAKPTKVHAIPGLLRELTVRVDAAAEKLAAEMSETGDHAITGMEKVGGVVRAVKQTADDMHALADDISGNGGPPLDGSSSSGH
jgi:hypothetical protein